MSRITVDDSLRAQLLGLRGKVELCDSKGKILGHFLPAEETTRLPHPDDGCPYTTEELQRFQQETGGRYLSEIWKGLQQT